MNDAGFSIKKYYNELRGDETNVQWSRMVWNRYSLPKHRMILWLAVQNRLKTKDRLMMMSICSDDVCTICGQETGSVDHLMFRCTYSKQCFEMILGWLRIQGCNRSLRQLNQWIRSRYKGTKTQKKVVIAATAYHIWRRRNIAYWEASVRRIEKTVQEIKFSVKHRSLQLLSSKAKARDREWIEKL
ncbi:uncharacterized protein LOC104901049 [Beta vulgaris subsp. vulgaris]|uniref:uncharacterized protein LOC104901049 n=1 Tax=Beta vulgaris subsp. vulgaris TaxID=3555 RepID=UPI00053FD1E0|nr:uncharacterized protein LOC104901049 [Beta vulgaris subsp. vulgaris]